MDYSERICPTKIDTGYIELLRCGKRVDAKNHSFGPAVRENYWLIFLEQGNGEYVLNDNRFRLEEGCIFVGFPALPIFYHADSNTNWTIRWVCLNSTNFAYLLEEIGLSPTTPVIMPKDTSAVKKVLSELHDLCQTDTVSGNMSCMKLIYNLLELLSDKAKKLETNTDYIDNAILYMSNSYDNDISIKDVADFVNLDRGYFSKLFHKRTGLTPSRWLINYRMEKAEALIKNTNLPIGEIARSVGYYDQLYFTRLFKSVHKLSPSEYRTTNKKP